jgi:site-specific recombinase XerD
VQVVDTRVNTFLESIGRNSKNSGKSYRTGLNHFTRFLRPRNQTPDSIIPQLNQGKINQYELLDQFVSYLLRQPHMATTSLKSYIAITRSYLEYNDIDISNSKFKRKVKIPKVYADQEEPLSLSDI